MNNNKPANIITDLRPDIYRATKLHQQVEAGQSACPFSATSTTASPTNGLDYYNSDSSTAIKSPRPRGRKAKVLEESATLNTKSKLFLCTSEGCNKVFKRNEHLIRHVRMHTGEKPFTCTYPSCQRKFTRGDNLAAHMIRSHDKYNDAIKIPITPESIVSHLPSPEAAACASVDKTQKALESFNQAFNASTNQQYKIPSSQTFYQGSALISPSSPNIEAYHSLLGNSARPLRPFLSTHFNLPNLSTGEMSVHSTISNFNTSDLFESAMILPELPSLNPTPSTGIESSNIFTPNSFIIASDKKQVNALFTEIDFGLFYNN